MIIKGQEADRVRSLINSTPALAKNSSLPKEAPQPAAIQAVFFETPSGGIDAATEASGVLTLASETCDIYKLEEVGSSTPPVYKLVDAGYTL